jgi:transcriptional regulator with XRE-family HTH domain
MSTSITDLPVGLEPARVHTLATQFAVLLRRFRRSAGLTQERLAERAMISVRGLQHLEAGDAQPYRATVIALVAALGLTAEQCVDVEAAAVRMGEHRDRSPRRVTRTGQ